MKQQSRITAKEMRIIDINSEYLGVPVLKLMENAGRGVAGAIKEKIDVKNKDILILCGTGNNGGDGFVAARYLVKEGAKVEVILIDEEERIRTSESRKNWEKIKGENNITTKIFVRQEEISYDRDIIVDALLGAGVKGELREPVKSIVRSINASTAFKASVDIPTGIDPEGDKGEQHVKADLVVSFHKAKRGLEKFDVVVKDIGIPQEAETTVGPGDLIVNLRRRRDSHKGDNGRVLVVGGSDLFYGAPILAALGALNSGTDLSILIVPEINFDISRAYSLDLIVRKYPGKYLNKDGLGTVEELLKRCNSLLIGPGLGLRDETRDTVLKILEKTNIPVVIDADGIKSLKGKLQILKEINAVLTPHAGEFKTLTGKDLPDDIEERKRVVKDFAEESGSVILLKSSVDIIASPNGRIKINNAGNPGMTGGGTGDVLSGLVAGFLAQGMGPFEAACCAAFVNGWSGDSLKEIKGHAFTASDLVDEVPFAIKEILDFK
ncbi:MAG: NAD(P)H-hydrate dehydratase [Candidatus Hydrothermarchaeales archaeon]